MTRRKSFKTRVRARMDKTGESYTTARRQLLGTPAEAASPASPVSAAVQAKRLTGAVLERTGRGWDEWFALLDAWGAAERTHTEIARRLREEYAVDGWWAQSVTVAYEQARGRRVPGQRSDGSFSVSAGKTVAVPVERLYAAFADPGVRERWLPGDLRVRTATPVRTFRADWTDGVTRIAVGFVPKGETRAQVALAHEKITDAETAAAMKAHWRERLDALKALLEG